jgi:subtilisin family serine protease
MGSKDSLHRSARKTNFETLEDRQVFSADPLAGALGAGFEHHAIEEPPLELHSEPALEQHSQELAVELHDAVVLDEAPSLVQHVERAADFWIDSSLETDVDVLFDKIEQTLASAHTLTGAVQARADYGFTGLGQTVVVIDSGIAWNHYALGGGYGASYRVVGGWDFAENDADPFDDGTAGKHGTHVAGIVGADAGTSGDSGVAPGVDLVSLRVFDDAGSGFFSWVESALRWVHTNKDAYENPITAINLSLGTSWNSASAPSWAMLEEEFAQLEADGIFISVSAGNSFTTYNAKGLSYPAASSHVVPVMSVDDNGNMSSFSQRHERAIGAPGRAIRSTLPDYAGNKNGITDDWGNLSGTSMAAPYVAGASAIVRQAMEFVGRTGIDQWDIYDHMMATADLFFDSATSTTYKRLDLKAAIDALMPTDDYGSTTTTAYSLGSLTANRTIEGLIGKTSDKDYFSFTASANGKVTLSADATHELAPLLSVTGSTATLANGVWTFDVVAGQTYTIGIETAAGGGIGYYDVDMAFAASAPAVEIIKTLTFNGTVYTLDAENWLNINGKHAWSDTRDFSLGADGSVYWLGTSGQFAHRLLSGTWQTLDRDATKYEVASNGTAYSFGVDGWVCMNGAQVWNNTADFALAADQSLLWLSNTGDMYRRSTTGVWSVIDRNVTKLDTGNDSVAYGLRTDRFVSVNGTATWQNSQDIMVMDNQTILWHSTDGRLYQKPNGGAWQVIQSSVNQFALRQDGALYTLGNDGVCRLNGSTVRTGVVDMRLNTAGQLVLNLTGGTTQTVTGGRFAVSKAMLGSSSVVGIQSGGGSAGGQGGSTQSLAAESTDVAAIASSFTATQFDRAAENRTTTASSDDVFGDRGSRRELNDRGILAAKLAANRSIFDDSWDDDQNDIFATIDVQAATDGSASHEIAAGRLNPRIDRAFDRLFEMIGD